MTDPIRFRPLTRAEQLRSSSDRSHHRGGLGSLDRLQEQSFAMTGAPAAVHESSRMEQFDSAGARRVLDRNEHEVIVADEEHAELVWRAVKRNTGMAEGEIDKAWEELLHFVGNNTAAYGVAVGDSVAFGKIAYDISRGGAGWKGVKAVFTSYIDEKYITFKGRSGLRRILTAPRYLKTNPKIVQLGLGSFDVGKSVKSGGVFTAILLCGFHVMDYLVRDTATMSQLIGNLGVDIAKVAVSTGMTFAITNSVLAYGTTMALGPVVIAVGVGLLLAGALDILDARWGIKQKVVAALNKIWSDFDAHFSRTNEMIIIDHSQERRAFFEDPDQRTLQRRARFQGRF